MKLLGYQIDSNGLDYLYASHPTRSHAILKGAQGAITFYGFMESNNTAREDRLGYLEFLNALNGGATTTHFTAWEDGRLVYQALYSGPYEKSAFGVFLVLWNLDTTEQFKTKQETLRKYMG